MARGGKVLKDMMAFLLIFDAWPRFKQPSYMRKSSQTLTRTLRMTATIKRKKNGRSLNHLEANHKCLRYSNLNWCEIRYSISIIRTILSMRTIMSHVAHRHNRPLPPFHRSAPFLISCSVRSSHLQQFFLAFCLVVHSVWAQNFFLDLLSYLIIWSTLVWIVKHFVGCL